MPMAVTCSNLNQLKVHSHEPFSHGHSKGVFEATLDGSEVVVKRPIGDFLTVRSAAARICKRLRRV